MTGYLQSLLSNERPVAPKVVKAKAITFTGHIPADKLEEVVDYLAENLPEGWARDDANVQNSLMPATGRFQRILMVRGEGDYAGANMTIFATGTVSIVRVDEFTAAWGSPDSLGIVEGKAVQSK